MNLCAEKIHHESWNIALDRVNDRVKSTNTFSTYGKIVKATGLVMEAVGLQLPIGACCLIQLPNQTGNDKRFAEAEVVGFSGDRLYLMPLSDVNGLVPGAKVYVDSRNEGSLERRYPSGMGLLGRVLNAFGEPLDDKGPLVNSEFTPNKQNPINPLSRRAIDTQIDVGIRSINALISVGCGQRMGLFAGSGVGKSVLLGMMARHTSADIVIVGLIGERGREVKEFIDKTLGKEGLKRSIVVAAPADNSPLQRLHAASYATRLAEEFRDQGYKVLLIMDSLTRCAMAQREIALAVGEPPATKGYPASVFAKLPALVERAGNGDVGSGSVTAFYTVLTEGDDQQDPVADSARAILDGHVVLSRTLAESGHYPAIDIEASVSRTMDEIVSAENRKNALRLKKLFSLYHRNRDLLSVGAYSPGHDKELDRAVQIYPKIEAFLQQDLSERSSVEDSFATLNFIVGEPQ